MNEYKIGLYCWFPGGRLVHTQVVGFDSLKEMERIVSNAYEVPSATLVRCADSYTLALLLECDTKAIMVGIAAGEYETEEEYAWIDEWVASLPVIGEDVDTNHDIQMVWED